MAYPIIKVYKENGSIIIDNGVKRREYASPASVSYSVLDDSFLRSVDIVTLKAFGLPVVTDKPVDSFCDEGGVKISPNVVLSELLTYFDSLGIAQNSGGGGDLTDYYTKEQVDQLLQDIVAGEVDLSNYVTVEQLATTLQSYPTNTTLASYYTSQQTNTAIANSLVAYYTKTQADSLLAGKVDKQPNSRLITDAEATKLAGLDSNHFKGEFISLSALQSAKPTASAGDYAYVDAGVGANTLQYNWDTSDNQWVQASSTGTSETPASIKSKYESNANTNAFTDLAKTTVANTSGVNTGDETAAGIRSKLGIATLSGNNTGDETATTIINKIGNGSTISSQYLPAYVDDVLEFANLASLPTTGETGKIYITLDTNFEYRWSGSIYIRLVASPGTTDEVPEGTTNKYYTDQRAIAANAPAIAASAGFQTETLAYQARVKAIANTFISGFDLSNLDQFVAKGKADGWWASVKFFAPMFGENLATSLVKFVVDASGLPSMTNNNLVETDYVKNKGLFIATNNNTAQKWVSTGVILPNNSITPSSVAWGFCIPDFVAPANPGNFVADNPATGNSNIYIGVPAAGTKRWSHNAAGMRVQTFSKLNGANATSINGGQAYYLSTGSPADEDFSTEITIAKSTQAAVVSYSPISLGCLIMTTGLNQTQTQQLNLALFTLMNRASRVNPIGGSMLAFGDSITYGQAAFPYSKRFAALVARSLNLNELNTGVPSSLLRQANGSVIGGFDRYLFFGNSIPFNTALMMYGTNDMLTDAQANGTTATITDFQTKYTTIINYWVGLGKIVYVASAPVYVAGNATKNQAYFNAQLAAAKAARVPFIDCYNIFLDTNNVSGLIPDGLHPSQAGNLLISDHIVARIQGKPYRDVLLPATTVPANGSATLAITMAELKQASNVMIGLPLVSTAGISYTVAWTSDDNGVITFINSTGVSITTTQTNLRVTWFTDI